MAEKLTNPKDINIKQTGLKIKFNPGGLLAALIRSAVDIATSKPSAATFAEWAKAVNFKTEKEQQIFNLVSKSMMRTIEEQLKEHLDSLDLDEKENPIFLKTTIKYEVFAKLNKKEFTFDCNHLSNPAAMDMMADFKPAYNKWLVKNFAMSDKHAADFSNDFPHYFAYQFSLELLSKTKDYQALLDWCNNAHNKATQEKLVRLGYRAKMKKKYHQPALGEKSVSLSDVYIEPRFLVYEKLMDRSGLEIIREDDNIKKPGPFVDSGFEGNIHQFILNHFVPKNNCTHFDCELDKGQVMLLLGQPGHGKSSFCYRSIHDLLSSDDFSGNAFFLRLQNANDNLLDGKIEDLAELVEDYEEMGFLDLVHKKHRQVNALFLDGLDELCMTKGLKEDDVLAFVNNCKRLVESNPYLRIIVTSRFNYVESSRLHRENVLVLSLDTLDEAQQIDLTQRFAAKWKEGKPKLTQAQIKNINKNSNLKHVKELIELPILLQMVLMSKVPVEESSSRGAIYNDLFAAVLNRKWSNEKRLKKYIKDPKDFAPHHLRSYLAFLAFKTFQGQKGYLRKSEVVEYSETKDFVRNFFKNPADGAGMKHVLKDILTSFYLKESHKKAGDSHEEDREYNYVIEFLHKSLYEYLACEHIWNLTTEYFLEKGRYGKPKTRTSDEVQRQMQETYATIRHTEETNGYLKEIVAQPERQKDHLALAQQMAEHLPGLLEEGFLHDFSVKSRHKSNRFTPAQLNLHAFHNYILIFCSLNLWEMEDNGIMKLEWETLVGKHLNGELWKKIGQYYKKRIDELAARRRNKKFLDKELHAFNAWKKEQIEAPVQPEGKTLHFANWVRRFVLKKEAERVLNFQIPAVQQSSKAFATHLRLLAAERLPMRLNLSYLNLEKADLWGFLAHRINFSGADLSNANLVNASLVNAYLIKADLSHAYLINAYLIKADLSHAYLINAYLRNAYLRNADLSDADLRNADLSHAYLSDADLRNADLRNADLSHADLFNAVVGQVDWMEKIEKWKVRGAQAIQEKYRVNPELVRYRDIYGLEREGYRIEENVSFG